MFAHGFSRALGGTAWLVLTGILLVLAIPVTALAQTDTGGAPGGGCFLGICDPGAWLRDLVPSIVADFLSGLITGLSNLTNSFFNDVNFITRTPETLTYRNELVRQFVGASQLLADGLLAVVTMVAGFNLMLRPYVGSTVTRVIELLPRLLLGGILINTAAWWCQLAIDVNNAACGVFGGGPPPNLVDAFVHTTLPFVLLIGLIYGVLGGLLVLQQLMRLGLIDVLLILAPLAALCWILPQTQIWARRWSGLFSATVFAQMVLTLTLRLGFNLATDLPPLSAAGLLQPMLGIAVLALALKIPGLMGGGAGGGTIVSSLIGSSAGAAVGAGVGVGVRARARGLGARVAGERTSSMNGSPGSNNLLGSGPGQWVLGLCALGVLLVLAPVGLAALGFGAILGAPRRLRRRTARGRKRGDVDELGECGGVFGSRGRANSAGASLRPTLW